MLHRRSISFKLDGTFGSIGFGSKKVSIDSHSHGESDEGPEDVRKNYESFLLFDPKSINEREGKIDYGKK